MMTTTTIVRRLVLAGLASGALAGVGCATVQPWQRGRLVDSCMIFDANGALVAYQTHWQESREGSSGGSGVQSGGCGCK